jgi:hypothetical protein
MLAVLLLQPIIPQQQRLRREAQYHQQFGLLLVERQIQELD